jgi:hypothetical protein
MILDSARNTSVSLRVALPDAAQQRVDVALTPRERLVLTLLIARHGAFVRDEEILGAAFGLFDGAPPPGALRRDIGELARKLAAAIGRDAIASAGKCGYRLSGVDLRIGGDER